MLSRQNTRRRASARLGRLYVKVTAFHSLAAILLGSVLNCVFTLALGDLSPLVGLGLFGFAWVCLMPMVARYRRAVVAEEITRVLLEEPGIRGSAAEAAWLTRIEVEANLNAGGTP